MFVTLHVEILAELAQIGDLVFARCLERLLVSAHVLVRPRVGDFVYTDDEFEIMKRDIAVAKELGVDGVVIGILTPEGEVDADRLAELHAIATPLHVGFHRAFDSVKDQDEALELLVSLQFDTILTSGAAPTAVAGAERLKHLVDRANDRIGIIAGGSITAETVDALVRSTGVSIVHGRSYEGLAAAVAGL